MRSDLPVHKVLFATDFGHEDRAQEFAVELAQMLGAGLVVVHACEIPTYVHSPLMGPFPYAFADDAGAAARAKLAEIVDLIRVKIPGVQGVLRHGSPWREIVDAVTDEHADLVVMGTHGRHGFARAVMGSVAERTVRMSPVPVLTIPAR